VAVVADSLQEPALEMMVVLAAAMHTTEVEALEILQQ
jgi:hypothetical protein